MSLIPDGDQPPSREEVRQLEARVDARFQAVSARFTTVDRRFAGQGERVEALELHTREVIDRFDCHCKRVDGRFDAIDARVDAVHNDLGVKIDATDARVDLVHDNAGMRIERANRRQGRVLVYAAVATGTVVAVVEFVVLALWGWFA